MNELEFIASMQTGKGSQKSIRDSKIIRILGMGGEIRVGLAD